jgi:hypothetical protein
MLPTRMALDRDLAVGRSSWGGAPRSCFGVCIFRRLRDRLLKAVIGGPTLPDSAPVVRGGTLRVSDLRKSADKALQTQQRYGLSVYAADVPSHADVLNAAGPRVVHAQVSLTTAGRLRQAGFQDIEQTQEPPHHTVWLADGSDAELKRFADAFDVPVPKASVTRASADPIRD